MLQFMIESLKLKVQQHSEKSGGITQRPGCDAPAIGHDATRILVISARRRLILLKVRALTSPFSQKTFAARRGVIAPIRLASHASNIRGFVGNPPGTEKAPVPCPRAQVPPRCRKAQIPPDHTAECPPLEVPENGPFPAIIAAIWALATNRPPRAPARFRPTPLFAATARVCPLGATDRRGGWDDCFTQASTE